LSAVAIIAPGGKNPWESCSRQISYSNCSFLERFPDQFRDINDKSGVADCWWRGALAYLTNCDADHIIEPLIPLIVAEMAKGVNDLPLSWRIRPAIPLMVEEDGCTIVRFDDPLEVRLKDTVSTGLGMVGAVWRYREDATGPQWVGRFPA
jgi:hypothetical protein